MTALMDLENQKLTERLNIQCLNWLTLLLSTSSAAPHMAQIWEHILSLLEQNFYVLRQNCKYDHNQINIEIG